MKECNVDLESCIFVLFGEKEVINDLLKETRHAKMLGEADLLHLQNSWSKENEKICDKVFEQLMNDLLA